MKNLVLSLTLFLTIGLSYVFAQSQPKEESLIDLSKIDTSAGNVTEKNIIYDGVKDFMMATASSLKVTVSHVYEILVKQQVVKSITYVVFFVFGLILTWVIYTIIIKTDFDDGDNAGMVLLLILLITIDLILFGFTLGNMNMIITGFVNPEMGAIYEIMDYIKELKNSGPPAPAK